MSEHSKPVRLAAAALTAAIDGKWEKATGYVQRINDECGPDSLPYVLMAWCDTLADHATDGRPIKKVAEVHGMNYDTGSMTDEPPPRVKWAQRIIKARAEMDQPAFTEVYDELSTLADGGERGAYVGAVLEAAALSMCGLPRGYAAMEWPS